MYVRLLLTTGIHRFRHQIGSDAGTLTRKEDMYCTHCQTEDPRPNAIFCKACGFRLSAQAPDASHQEPASKASDKTEARAATAESRCRKCSAPVSAGRRYCAACCGVPDNPMQRKAEVVETPAAPDPAKAAAPKPASPEQAMPVSEPPPKAAPGSVTDSVQAEVPPVAPAKPAQKKRPRQKAPPASQERPAAVAAASPQAPVQHLEKQPTHRTPDPLHEPAFEPVPPPIGPALGPLDDPLPETPRKRPRRHFQHWGLLTITTLLTLAALAAGGYYTGLFEIDSGAQAQSSATEERRTELQLPPALMEQPQATPLQASLHNPVTQSIAGAGAQAPAPDKEAREQPALKPDRAVAQSSKTEQKTAKQKVVKPKVTRQSVAARKPASRLASQKINDSPRAKPYSASPADPASTVASLPKAELEAPVAPSPAPQASAIAVESPSPQATGMAKEQHDPLYLQKKEQELDHLLRQLQ